MADTNDDLPDSADTTTPEQQCNSRITDSVTQCSVHTLDLGPAVAAVDGALGQSQAQAILFANMVNQQAQLAAIAAATLTEELNELLKAGDTQ